jgi:hypothetical protein
LVYHYDRNGGKQLTRDSQRRVGKLVAIWRFEGQNDSE